ncbi:hypothetical protein Tco_1003921 [Tanacetum coccineum]|uniref:Uncharacterized protein n=1 Tax=Tanacetum coccineum TaxID=301880 RepID=A0ABQ5FAF5_9ASTR
MCMIEEKEACNDDRDEDPPARPNQGLKRRKTSKDVEPSKRSKSIGSSKGNTPSQPKPKSTGPVYNLLKGTCKSCVELEYNMEECYKALNDQQDWDNPEGDRCPFDLSKPLPLVESQGRKIVPSQYFFNNDLEYLRGGSTDRNYTTSITKTKAAKYDLKGDLHETCSSSNSIYSNSRRM